MWPATSAALVEVGAAPCWLRAECAGPSSGCRSGTRSRGFPTSSWPPRRARDHVIDVEIALRRSAPTILAPKSVAQHQVPTREAHDEARRAIVTQEMQDSRYSNRSPDDGQRIVFVPEGMSSQARSRGYLHGRRPLWRRRHRATRRLGARFVIVTGAKNRLSKRTGRVSTSLSRPSRRADQLSASPR